MLKIRPNCENCNKSLPPNSTQAMICSFECTWCSECNNILLKNVCPNCGGNLQPRPIRPIQKLIKYPESNKEVYKPINIEVFIPFRDNIKDTLPEKR